jgi:hypothetical protein
MSKRPTDLEAIVNALEALEHGETWEEDVYRYHRCPLCAAPPPNHTPECIMPAILATAKRLRDAAVEGWVDPEEVAGAREIGERVDFFPGAPTYPYMRRCLLIPLADDPEKPDA